MAYILFAAGAALLGGWYTMSLRNEIRNAFFANKIGTEEVMLKSGLKVEVRQPTVEEQLALAGEPDSSRRMLVLFTKHVFVPGTGELVFEEADFDTIKQQPAGGDYTKIMTALTSVMDLEAAVAQATKLSVPAASSAQSTT